jgi:predicted nucleotide-binding protein
MPTRPSPKLLVSRNDAERKITGQITKGSEILRSLGIDRVFLPHELRVNGGKTFEKVEAEREKWAKFTVHLLETLFDNDSVAREFGETWLHYSASEVDDIEQFEDWMKEKIVRLESIVERLPLYHLAEKPVSTTAASARPKHQSKNIFIVHGHDEAAEHEVARFIQQIGLNPIILHEKPDRGKTLIEKVESHSDVGFAVILLTPDDVGHPKDEPGKTKPRARQNVVLELGYFIGILGRARVCALLKGDIEIPTDFAGVLYKLMDNAGAWKVQLAKEILHAGIDVDLKNAL